MLLSRALILAMRTARGQAVDLDKFEALDQGETLHRSVTQGLSCERRGYAIVRRAGAQGKDVGCSAEQVVKP